MATELISKGTLLEFREVLVRFKLREIEDIFTVAGIEAAQVVRTGVSGQRRTLTEQYYASLDLRVRHDADRLAAAFAVLIDQLQRGNGEGFYGNFRDPVPPLLRRMELDGWRFDSPSGKFLLVRNLRLGIEPVGVLGLSEASVDEHIQKAREKIEAGDFAGAISSAYTFVEDFLKTLLKKVGVQHNPDEGDIRSLYALVANPLNLNPGGESLESHLKPIVQGLKGQVAGLFAVANKAGDRHARRYNPARHHATLAVNSAFTVCEFLLGSFEYQRKKLEGQTKAS